MASLARPSTSRPTRLPHPTLTRYYLAMSESYVAVAQGPIDYIKELISRCEKIGIEVSLDRCRTKS